MLDSMDITIRDFIYTIVASVCSECRMVDDTRVY